jgi:Transcriptional regulator containing PAS, AAA-type ATPase, and DNA-binding domains
MVIRHLENNDWGLITRDLLREGANIKIKTSLEIKDFMRPNPWIVTEDSTLRMVGDIMINKKIDGVPIVDDEGKLIGLVSKTLLLTEVLKGTDWDRPVKDIMITDVIAAGPEDDVAKLITVNIANLPVVNDQEKVLGIVTLSDTIRAYFSSLIAVREQLHTIIDSAHNGILTVNDEGNIVMVNSAVEEFFKLNWNDIIGRQISDILPDSQLLDVLETGQVYLGKKLVYGDRVFISNHSPVVSNGEIIGAVAVFSGHLQF